MAKSYVEGKVMVAFKPEAEQSAIEKVLDQYTFEKVFGNGEFSNATEREDKVLDRLYSLTTTPGTEAAVMEGLRIKYGSLIEYVQQTSRRRIMS